MRADAQLLAFKAHMLGGVALTLTASTDRLSAAAIFSRIWSMCGASLGPLGDHGRIVFMGAKP